MYRPIAIGLFSVYYLLQSDDTMFDDGLLGSLSLGSSGARRVSEHDGMLSAMRIHRGHHHLILRTPQLLGHTAGSQGNGIELAPGGALELPLHVEANDELRYTLRCEDAQSVDFELTFCATGTCAEPSAQRRSAEAPDSLPSSPETPSSSTAGRSAQHPERLVTHERTTHCDGHLRIERTGCCVLSIDNRFAWFSAKVRGVAPPFL